MKASLSDTVTILPAFEGIMRVKCGRGDQISSGGWREATGNGCESDVR
jgi:hypothetical protein